MLKLKEHFLNRCIRNVLVLSILFTSIYTISLTAAPTVTRRRPDPKKGATPPTPSRAGTAPINKSGTAASPHELAQALIDNPAVIKSTGTNDFGGMISVQTNAMGVVIKAEPRKISFNFQDQDIRTLLVFLSELTGETLLPEANIKGTVTVINPHKVTLEEAKQIIYSTLEMSGFTPVKYEHLTKIVKSGNAKTRPIRTLQPPKSITDLDEEDIIRSQLIYPENISAAQVQQFIRPLVTQGAGDIIIDERTGAVIIIDTGANIKRLLEIIAIIDKVVEGGEIDVQIISMKYADVEDVRTTLEGIFNAPALKDPSAQSVQIKGNANRSGARNASNSGQKNTTLKLAGGQSTVTFITEPRLSALIVISLRRNFPLINSIIERLDIPSNENEDIVHIYPLQHVIAEDIAATLNSIFGGAGSSRTSSRNTSSRNSSRNSSSSRRSQPSSRNSSNNRSSGLTHLAGKVEVLIDEPSNSLLILTSPRYYASIKRIIEKLDQRTPQVFIEALIVEVTRKKDFNLGVGWKKILDHGGYASPIQMLDTTLGPVIDSASKEIASASTPGLAYSFGKFQDDGSFDPYFTLQTAEGITDINVLSAPSVLASNGEEASIRVGEQYPIARYSTDSDGGNDNYSYEYIDIDIELTMEPRINRHREISIISNILVKENGGIANAADPMSPPIVLTRSVKNIVVVQDNQTIVMGGIIKDVFNTSESRVPILGSIPIIKHAFRTTTQEKRKTELLIFITPTVVTDMFEADELTNKTREKNRGVEAFVQDGERRLLYDDVNYSKSQLTIEDDWREFEQKVDFVETYLTGETKTYETPKEDIWIHSVDPKDIKDNEPFEGSMEIESNEAFDGGDLPWSIDRPANMTKSDEELYNVSPEPKNPSILEREKTLLTPKSE